MRRIYVSLCALKTFGTPWLCPRLLFTHFWWAFVPIHSMSARKNLKFAASVPEIIGGTQEILGSLSLHPRSLFSQVFNGLLFGGTPWNWMYVPNLKTVALPVPEIIGGSKKIPAIPVYVTLTIPKLESLICIFAAGIFAADALRLSSLKCLWRAPWILFISARVTFWPFKVI